jgi:hypothetical protein
LEASRISDTKLIDEAIEALEGYLKKHPWDYHEERDIQCLLFRELRARFDREFESSTESGQLMGLVHTEFSFRNFTIPGRKRAVVFDIVIFRRMSVQQKLSQHEEWLITRDKAKSPLHPSDLLEIIEIDQWAAKSIPSQKEKEDTIRKAVLIKEKLELDGCGEVGVRLVLVCRHAEIKQQIVDKIEEAKKKGVKVHLIELPTPL